jgi:transcriptional regulatory protein LevR
MSNPFIKVTWEDVPENFTPEKIRRVKSYFEKKYNAKTVQVITKTLTSVNQTRLESLEASDNILDHQYQKKLKKDFIKDNEIDIKWELVDRLDNKVNIQIDKLNETHPLSSHSSGATLLRRFSDKDDENGLISSIFSFESW